MSGNEQLNCQCDYSEKHNCKCQYSEIENIIECFDYQDCECPCHKKRHEFSEDGHSEEDEYW